MTDSHTDFARSSQQRWLKLYYFARTVFSAVWVAAAFTVGQHSSTVAAVLLVAYPAWDAVANYLDASRSGGLAQNRTQTINVVVILATTLAVVVALQEADRRFGRRETVLPAVHVGAARWTRAR